MEDRRTMILGPPRARALPRFRRAESIGPRRWTPDYVPAGRRQLPGSDHQGHVPAGTRSRLANAQRSAAGWVTARDRLHGRVVDRRPIVEMAPPHSLDTVVNGRATDPDPRALARVSAFSPMRSALPAPVEFRKPNQTGRVRANRSALDLARIVHQKVERDQAARGRSGRTPGSAARSVLDVRDEREQRPYATRCPRCAGHSRRCGGAQ